MLKCLLNNCLKRESQINVWIVLEFLTTYNNDGFENAYIHIFKNNAIEGYTVILSWAGLSISGKALLLENANYTYIFQYEQRPLSYFWIPAVVEMMLVT